MTRTITLIEGDGIGPEVTAAVVRVLDCAGFTVNWERHLAGVLALEKHGDTLPAELLDSTGAVQDSLVYELRGGPVAVSPAEGGIFATMAWARLTDRVGRRPLYVWSCASVSTHLE